MPFLASDFLPEQTLRALDLDNIMVLCESKSEDLQTCIRDIFRERCNCTGIVLGANQDYSMHGEGVSLMNASIGGSLQCVGMMARGFV